MRLRSSVLLSMAVAASIALPAAPAARAQCASPQVFGSTGLAKLGMVQVEIAGGLTGTEIGRFWNAGDSASANNLAGTCPAADWLLQRTSGDRGVSGGISVGTCVASSCPGPDDEMIWILEDVGSSGPYGVDDTAGFIGFRMDATPPAARYWDLARAAGNVPATLPFNPFPQVVVTFTSRIPGGFEIMFDLDDPGENFWGENASGPIPDTASIVSYDICFHKTWGTADLGRSRSSWDCPISIPYTGGPNTGNYFSYQCEPGQEVALVVGITFSGGAGGNVQSELVGEAWVVECWDGLADPDSVPQLRRRPYIHPNPSRGGR